jgi:hypothetical protein
MEHRIHYIPDKYYTNLPFTMEMVWTVAIGVDAGELAQVINWGIGLGAVGWIVLLTRQAGLEARYAVVAGVLFYSITTVADQSMSGSVELGGTLFLLAGAYLLLVWLGGTKTDWWTVVLAGVLAGLYAGSKLPNAIAVIMLTAWLCWVVWRRYGLTKGVRVALVFGAVAAVVVGVWYFKSWIMTGNPVYPFLHTALGGPPIRSELWSDSGVTAGQLWAESLRNENPLYRLVVQPYRLLMEPQLVRGHIGPLWLAFLPIGLVVAWKSAARRPVLILAALGAAQFLYWVPFYFLVRSGLPSMAFFAPVVALGAVWLWEQGKYCRGMVTLAFAGWFIVSMISSVRDVRAGALVSVGVRSTDAYLMSEWPKADGVSSYESFAFMNEELPPDSKVLLWDSRGYYLERPYVFALEFIGTVADSKRIYDPEQVGDELRRSGITHVAMTNNYLRLRLRETLEASGELDCVYERAEVKVCAIAGGA